MRLGLIARSDARGLGVQTKAMFDHLKPAKTLVVCNTESTRVSAMPLRIRQDWYPGAQTCPGLPSAGDLDIFLNDVDVVYTAETGYGHLLWNIAEKRGIRTVLAANFEFLNPHDRPTLWAAPSRWHLEDFPKGAVHLPVPVELDRFPTERKPEITPHFLHLIGRPATVKVGGQTVERAGTVDLLKALRYVTEPVTVTIRCQQAGYVDRLIAEHNIRPPKNVVLRIEYGDVENYWDLYREGDVLVLPRRWGGLSLPTNEAIAAGMPCLMPDISPNNLWLPKSWLFPAAEAGSFVAKQRIHFYRTDPKVLAAKLNEYATLPPPSWRPDVERLRQELSWETLRPRYEEVLSNVRHRHSGTQPARRPSR